MAITIRPNMKLREIQDAFHEKFPHLKIEFFNKGHERGAPSASSSRINPEYTLAKAGEFDGTTVMNVDGHLKVVTFEHNFQEHYGIGVQVFRQAGSAWILTTKTDDWTLAHQNRDGEADSMELEKEEDISPADWED